MAGRDRTCGASRFRRALYRLSYGHTWARLESNQRLLACKTSALAELSYSPWIRDKGSNLDLHGQSVASCRLDDPGTVSRWAPRCRSAPAGLVEKGDVPHGACALLGIHQHAVPRRQDDRRVVWVADRALRVDLRIPHHLVP